MSTTKKSKAVPTESTDDLRLLHSLVVYDKKTGRILETHRFSGNPEKKVSVDKKNILQEALENPMTLARVTDQNPKYLAVMVADNDSAPLMGKSMIDIGANKIVDLPKLLVTAAKPELDGDGKDETVIDISVVDSKGKLIRGYNGTVQVRTSRGKLSARGGSVELKGGKGSLTLRSVDETVPSVEIQVIGVDLPSKPGVTRLAFM